MTKIALLPIQRSKSNLLSIEPFYIEFVFSKSYDLAEYDKNPLAPDSVVQMNFCQLNFFLY